MPIDRALRIRFDSDSDQEKGSKCIQRLMAVGIAAGVCVDTYGTYTPGTGTWNLVLDVDGITSVQRSVSIEVDEAVTVAKWHMLIKKVIDAVDATGAVITETWGAFSALDSTDSVKLTITAEA